jgi:hypothetical protein
MASDSNNDPTLAMVHGNTTNPESRSRRPSLRSSTRPASNAFTAASEEYSPSERTADSAAGQTTPANRFPKSPSINAAEISPSQDVMRDFSSGNSAEPLSSGSGVPLLPSVPAVSSSIENLSIPSILDNNPFDSSYALSVGDLLSDLSLIENEVLPNEDFITQWQTAMGTGHNATNEITVRTVFHACMKSYDTMLPVWYKALEDKEAVRHTLSRNHILLSDWGASYAVLDGQLDELPKEAENVTETVLSFLTEVSTILTNSKIL